MFNTSINNSDSAKPEVVNTSEGCAAIKRNLDRLIKQQKTRNETKRKCKDLLLWRNTRYQYRREAKWDLRVLVGKLTMSQQCALTSKMLRAT